MTLEDIPYETITDEIKKGHASLLDPSFSKAFNEFISNHFPWAPVTGYKIDWERVSIPYKRIKWDQSNEDEIENFLKNSCLKPYKEVCIIYSAEKSGLLVELNEYVCHNLWRFIPPGFGNRFIVGIKRDRFNNIKLVYECFVEIDVDLSEWLTYPESQLE